jgi:hypothetical protein
MTSDGLIDEDLHQLSLGLIDEALISSIKRLDQALADLVIDIRRGSSRKMLLPSSQSHYVNLMRSVDCRIVGSRESQYLIFL